MKRSFSGWKKGVSLLTAFAAVAALLPVFPMAAAAYAGPYYNDDAVRQRVWKSAEEPAEQDFIDHNVFSEFTTWDAWNNAFLDRSRPLGWAVEAGQIEFRAAAVAETENIVNSMQQPAISVDWRRDGEKNYKIPKFKPAAFFDTYAWNQAGSYTTYRWGDSSGFSDGSQWFPKKYIIMRDVMAPYVAGVNYVDGGELYQNDAKTETKLIGGRIQVDVVFNEPVDPATAANLKINMDGKPVQNLSYIGAQKWTVDSLSRRSCEPESGSFDVSMTFRYAFDVPEDIQNGSFTFDYDQPVTDYFGGNALTNLQTTIKWSAPALSEVNTVAPSFEEMLLYPAADERYYTTAEINGTSGRKTAKTVYAGMRFKNGDNPVLPDGTRLKAAVYEDRGAGDKGEPLREITFSYLNKDDVREERSSGMYLDPGAVWFRYEVQADDPAGVIDLRTGDTWMDQASACYDLVNIFTAADGSALDVTTLRGSQSRGPRMRADSMRTSYRLQGEGTGSGTVLGRQYIRGSLPRLSASVDSDSYQNEHTLYLYADQEGVYDYSVWFSDLISSDSEKRDNGFGKASVYAPANANRLQFLNAQTGEALGTGQASGAVNLPGAEPPVGGLTVKWAGLYVAEAEVPLKIRATDRSGAVLHSEEFTVRLDNQAPRVSSALGKGIDPADTPGAAPVPVYYKLFAEDIGMAGGAVKYRYVHGDDPEFTDAEYVADGGYYNAPLTVPQNELYDGTLEFYAVDSAGNTSQTQSTDVTFNNLVPFNEGQVNIETDGYQSGHVVTVSPDILNVYTVEYYWRTADSSARPVTGASYREYTGGTIIGSAEDQALWTQDGGAFNGSYTLTLRARDEAGNSFSQSYSLYFLNEAPETAIDESNPYLGPGGTISVNVNTPVLDSSEYQLRRPGDDAKLYDSGSLAVGSNTVTLPDTLTSGYYELSVSSQNEIGTTTAAMQFVYLDESKLDWKLDSAVANLNQCVIVSQNGTDYLLTPYASPHWQIKVNLPFSFAFENGDLFDWSKTTANPLERDADGDTFLSSTGTDVSYDNTAGRVTGTIREIPLQASGGVHVWFQMSGRTLTSDAVDPLGRYHVIEDYPSQLSMSVQKAERQEDGSVVYHFVPADPLGLATVTEAAPIGSQSIATVYQLRSYAYRNSDQVEGPAFGSANISNGTIPNDPETYYEWIQDQDGHITGVKFKKSASLHFTAQMQAEGLTGAMEVSLTEDGIATARSVENSLCVDYGYSDEMWEQNAVLLYGTKYYPVNTPRQYAGDVNFNGGNNDAGYMRPSTRLYSDVYEIRDFALLAMPDYTAEGDYKVKDSKGNWPYDFMRDGKHELVSQADIDRFDNYLAAGKLTLETNPLSVSYLDEQGAELFTELHESQTITLLDNSEYRTYWLCAQLALENGQTRWVYVADSFWPNSYLGRNSMFPTKFTEDFREIPDFDFSDQSSAASDAATGLLPLTYASAVLSADEFQALFPGRNPSEIGTGLIIYDLTDAEKQAAREYARSQPSGAFQQSLKVTFAPGGQYQYFFISMDGATVGAAKFSESDYDIPYASPTTDVRYYSNYSQSQTWDGEAWISLYSDNDNKTPADIAIEIKPKEGESEYYYVDVANQMHARIDETASVVLTAQETGGNPTLDALIGQGKTLYQTLVLRPSPDFPEDPFGTYTVMAVNVTQQAVTYSVPVKHHVQATRPTVTITEELWGNDRYFNVEAADDKSGVESLAVWIDDVQQQVSGGSFRSGAFDKSAETAVRAKAVNRAGLSIEEAKTFAPDTEPTAPPALGTDYTISYRYKDAQGQLQALAPDGQYGLVYAVVELLNSKTEIRNNGGKPLYAFLPGSAPNFTFELGNKLGTTSQLVTNPSPISAESFASAGFALDAGGESATISVTVSADDIAPANVELAYGGQSVPLTAGSGVYTAVVRQNGTYSYGIKKDGYTLKTGTLNVSGIAAYAPLSVSVSYSKETPTYNNVVVRFTPNKAAQVIGVAGSADAVQLSDTQYVFRENGSLSVTFTDGVTNETQTAQVANIDTTPPDAAADVAYAPNQANAVISFRPGADALAQLTLSGVRKLDGGFLGTGTLVGKPLSEVDVRLYQNGIYRFTVTDAAGNAQNLDVSVDQIDDTLPEILDVLWKYQSGDSNHKAPSGGYVEILEKDGNAATNEDLSVTITTSKDVVETGTQQAEYKKEFVKVFPVNASVNYVFEDQLGNAASLRLKTDIIDKGLPVIEFENGDSLSYYELNQADYSIDDFYQFSVGDYKDNGYTPMDKSEVSIDFGEFNPNDLSANVFDYKRPYIVTYTVRDGAGNETKAERVVRLFGRGDICVLVDGRLPDGGIAETSSTPFQISIENYSGVVFASIQAGEYNSAQMKNRGTPLTLNEDGKSFTANVEPRKWYTVSVRTETMESFTFKVWVN